MAQWFGSLLHGFPMDCTVAGYLTVVPLLLVVASMATGSRVVRTVENVYYVLVAVVLAAVFSLDLVLYGYWNFRLDSTPLFYFSTSPEAAMASATASDAIVGVVGFTAMAALVYLLCRKFLLSVRIERSHSWKPYALAVVLAGLLFIPIRGGFTVSTMNISRAYYSTNARLNHAAVNPAFSLLYSATHQTDFSSQYRFFDEAEAERIFADMNVVDSCAVDSTSAWLRIQRPDICLVLLESFSSHLMPSLGGENIAVGLDSLGREGMLFSHIFASSFRTDRALPAVISAFPGQPSTSLMKFTGKTERLPSLPMSLKENGYDLAYYYGGDANFTNMRAYLANCGFGEIISDRDFPISERLSKWGVHDHLVFRRALRDLAEPRPDGAAPRFTIIQTSSSHEPFEVPYSNPRFAGNARANAFAYADSCLFDFVDSLRTLPSFERTLLVIVPDHYGAWPENLQSPFDRHRVPVVFAGGALARKGVIDTVGSQTDLAATILSALSILHDGFTFSRDLFDPSTRHYAFFSEPSMMALVDANGGVALNADTGKITAVEGNPDRETLARDAKAYLQKLYTVLSSL